MTNCMIGLPKNILIKLAAIITMSAIKSIFPMTVKSLLVFIANIESPPKATVVSIKALAIMDAPPARPSILVKSGASVKPLTNVNPNSKIRFSPAFSWLHITQRVKRTLKSLIPRTNW